MHAQVLKSSFEKESPYTQRMADEQSFYDYIRTRVCLYVAEQYGVAAIPPSLQQFSPLPSRQPTQETERRSDQLTHE